MMTQSRQTQLSLLAMFVALLLIFGTLSWFMENTAERHREYMYEMCLARNARQDQLNNFYARMMVIEQHNPYAKVSPVTVKDRIAAYKNIRLEPIACRRDG